MKRALLLTFTISVLFLSRSAAQQYKTAVGLGIDFGDGSTLVGPAIKYFFKEQQAVEGEILFGNHATFLQAFYQYHQAFPNAKNLNWYIGGGPSLGFYGSGYYGTSVTRFYLRPMAGLDYKLADVPLAISFDWRPFLDLGSNAGSRFTVARFEIGIKYVLSK